VHEHGRLLLPRARQAELVAELRTRPAEDVLGLRGDTLKEILLGDAEPATP
jgi:hypothetical protein